ncbi:hypothetical protein L211DRAFT_851696 [Terfezia boudieri ATCC MYA-4762]|uniref:Uncharacterized protein n=1 Tax=Terfezia boudieri ATCC MYA-4762 TaxID=1051890 RepID=A0A3N4LIA6_9PEZI|nr:hypothetical protein L211DRAFT_851696 [Terfezia boudieri ATCC MYA-4762]
MGDWDELLISGPPAVQRHRRHLEEDDAPAAMPFGKTEPLFTPKESPPAPFNPDFDGDGHSDISHNPIRKEDKPKETEVPDNDSGNDGNGGNSFNNLPNATEADLPPPNQAPATTIERTAELPTETSTVFLDKYSRTTRLRYSRTTASSGPRETTTTHPAEARESTTSRPWTWITTETDSPKSTTLCTTIPHFSTDKGSPFKTTCYYETTIPLAIEQDIVDGARGIENLFKDTGKLVAVILFTMVLSVLMTVSCIWAYKWRAKKRKRVQGGESIGGDVEGGAEMKRKFWGVLGGRKEQGTIDQTSAVSVTSAPAAGRTEALVPPEMAQHHRLSIILPPGSGHRHHNSNNTILDRTLSTASSLTVPPYPASSAASGTTRSNSTRTARSVASNITDDTVVRTKREYRDAVGRLAEENMHSDHVAVADGFHLAPPNPFEEVGPPVAGAGGMGGSGVGVGGLGDVDGEGNRRVVVRAPPPIIRVGDVMNPFEDPDVDLDMGVADGFSPNGAGDMMRGGIGMRHSSPLPPRLENPFEDGLGGYPEVDVGMGNGFSGYVPGQMEGRVGGTAERRVSMRGGDARRRVSGDGVSLNSSTSGESLSSNETLRGDLEDWSGGGSGGSGPGGHVSHGSSGRL